MNYEPWFLNMEDAERMTLPISPIDRTFEPTGYEMPQEALESRNDGDTETGDSEKDYDLISKFWVDILCDTESED